jgi:hypothetical protein
MNDQPAPGGQILEGNNFSGVSRTTDIPLITEIWIIAIFLPEKNGDRERVFSISVFKCRAQQSGALVHKAPGYRLLYDD